MPPVRREGRPNSTGHTPRETLRRVRRNIEQDDHLPTLPDPTSLDRQARVRLPRLRARRGPYELTVDGSPRADGDSLPHGPLRPPEEPAFGVELDVV